MDLKSYLIILRANIWVILSTLIITVIVVTIITFMITPTYTATTTLRVATASSASVSYTDYAYADRLMNTYTKIATSTPVMDELAKKLNLQIIPQIKVVTIPNTELMQISVESPQPGIAQSSANALAEILTAQAKEFYSGGGKSPQEILGEQLTQAEAELTQARQEYDVYVSQNPKDAERIAVMNDAIQLKEKTYATLLDQYDQARLRETIRANLISVVDPAGLPLMPSKPNWVLNMGLGFMVGLAGGIGLAFLFENLNTRLYTSKQIEAVAELATIGKIPPMERRSLFTLKKHYVDHINSPFKESFRRLQMNIMRQNQNSPDGNRIKTLLVTSSEPGEGKSTITTNLALAIAQSGQKVIVVDCDLHKPYQHKILGLPNNIGLSTVLSQQANIEGAVQKTRFTGVHVLTSGPLPPNPSKMLGSSQMKSLIKELTQQYDMVLLDAPALLVVADPALLIPSIDSVIFVVRRNYIREEAVREACKQLANTQARTIGLVVNEAERNGTYYYYRER